jgi:DNA invertase Pin-like site-specific DNA recombinase
VISERVRAGTAKAKSQGKRWGGRKTGLRPKLTPERSKAIRALLAAGTKKVELARQLGIDRSTIYLALRLISRSS